MKIKIYFIVAFCFVLVTCQTIAQQQEQPNIIFILADDMSHDAMGFMNRYDLKTPTIDKIAEISRLTINKEYRRRQEDGLYGVESYLKVTEGGVLPNRERTQSKKVRIQPYLILGLFKEMYHVSKKLGITHWYMITEKKLWYALKRFDLIFRQIGEPVNYHGVRIPYLGIIDEIEQHLMKKHMDLYKDFLVGLDKQYWPAELR